MCDSSVMVKRGERGAYFSGVATCGSVWGCPVCRAKVCNERAKEIVDVCNQWGLTHGPLARRRFLATFTIRHSRNDDLRELGGKLLDAIRRFWQGADWYRVKKSLGLEYIRGWETTWGRSNGWHPHVHALMLTSREVSEEEEGELHEWFIARWMRIVAEVVDGVKGWTQDDEPTPHQPDWAHGFDLRATTTSEYVAKLGLELADPGSKRGRKEGRYTPFQLAWSHREGELPEGLQLFREYVDAMRGRRQLTWSHGLRDLRNAIAQQNELHECDDDADVMLLEAGQWDELRDLRARVMPGRNVVEVSTRWGEHRRVYPLDDLASRDLLRTGEWRDARVLLLECVERWPDKLHRACSLLGNMLESDGMGCAYRRAQHNIIR